MLVTGELLYLWFYVSRQIQIIERGTHVGVMKRSKKCELMRAELTSPGASAVRRELGNLSPPRIGTFSFEARCADTGAVESLLGICIDQQSAHRLMAIIQFQRRQCRQDVALAERKRLYQALEEKRKMERASSRPFQSGTAGNPLLLRPHATSGGRTMQPPVYTYTRRPKQELVDASGELRS